MVHRDCNANNGIGEEGLGDDGVGDAGVGYDSGKWGLCRSGFKRQCYRASSSTGHRKSDAFTFEERLDEVRKY